MDETFSEPADREDDTPLAWEGRVFAVALFWSIPAALLGGIFYLFLPLSAFPEGGLLFGGLTGLLAGGLLEASNLG